MKVLVKPAMKSAPGGVHCPICTHTVEARVILAGRHVFVQPGQKCPRCAASLDAGYVLGSRRAA
ncbi:MAG: hypothetical protein HY822_03700 [Acidobacteria bacterium]|nr:hypothetical protein [Acidobacteriota bacterium]